MSSKHTTNNGTTQHSPSQHKPTFHRNINNPNTISIKKQRLTNSVTTQTPPTSPLSQNTSSPRFTVTNSQPSLSTASSQTPLYQPTPSIQHSNQLCTKCTDIIPHLPYSLLKKFVPKKTLKTHFLLSCPYHIHELSKLIPDYLITYPNEPQTSNQQRLISYYKINLLNFLQHNVRQNITPKICTTNPTLTELSLFCSGSNVTNTRSHWPGRLQYLKDYYPSSPIASFNSFVSYFNQETPFSHYAPFHWANISELTTSNKTSPPLSEDWKTIKTIEFYNCFSTITFFDSSSNPWVPFKFIEDIFHNHKITCSTLPPSFLLTRPTRLLTDETAEFMDNYLGGNPSSSHPEIYTMIPAITAARALEILMSLLAHREGITHYTPITGTLIILDETTPFIIINGIPYISWNWASQIVPKQHNHMTYHSHGKQTLQLQRPFRIHGWLRIHWNLANLISGLPYQSSILTPLQTTLISLNTTASWVHFDRQLDLPTRLSLKTLSPA